MLHSHLAFSFPIFHSVSHLVLVMVCIDLFCADFILIFASHNNKDLRGAVLVRLKFHASVKRKSGVLIQKLQDENSLMVILDTICSTPPAPASADAIVPVNRH